MNDEGLNERRVRYLYEAVQAGSIRAAADKLDVNASVLSRQISLLEDELASPLLERHGRGVKSTEAGRLLIDYFRQQIAHKSDVLAKLLELRTLSRGQVDLVLGEGFVSDLMADPLQLLWKRYPGLRLTLNLAGTNEVLRMVAEDQAHIGLVYNPPVTPEIRSRATVRQPMCAIMAPAHPLARKEEGLSMAELEPCPVALMHGSYGTRQIIEMAERMERIRLVPALTTNSISVIKHFVRAGFGISLLPAFAVSQEIEGGELLAVPIQQSILASAEAHIITRLGRQLSAAANQVLLQLGSSMKAFNAVHAPAGSDSA